MATALRIFVDNVKLRMAELGITQQELAERADVHYVTIHKVLSKKMNPSLDMAEKIAKGVSLPISLAFVKHPKKTK